MEEEWSVRLDEADNFCRCNQYPQPAQETRGLLAGLRAPLCSPRPKRETRRCVFSTWRFLSYRENHLPSSSAFTNPRNSWRGLCSWRWLRSYYVLPVELTAGPPRQICVSPWNRVHPCFVLVEPTIPWKRLRCTLWYVSLYGHAQAEGLEYSFHLLDTDYNIVYAFYKLCILPSWCRCIRFLHHFGTCI